MSNININQFTQVPILGQLDLQVSQTGIVSGMVASAQTLDAGYFVDLLSSNTAVGMPQFTSAAQADEAFGAVIYDIKTAIPAALTYCQVAMLRPGVCMWLLSATTINPGSLVEQASTQGTVQALASNKLRGVTLDPMSNTNLGRVILFGQVS